MIYFTNYNKDNVDGRLNAARKNYNDSKYLVSRYWYLLVAMTHSFMKSVYALVSGTKLTSKKPGDSKKLIKIIKIIKLPQKLPTLGPALAQDLLRKPGD